VILINILIFFIYLFIKYEKCEIAAIMKYHGFIFQNNNNDAFK